jgi:hypothetical protein
MDMLNRIPMESLSSCFYSAPICDSPDSVSEEDASLFPFGPQNISFRRCYAPAKTHFFLFQAEISTKEDVFYIIYSLFQCSRVAISEESMGENGACVCHVLFELAPSLLWKSVTSLPKFIQRES